MYYHTLSSHFDYWNNYFHEWIKRKPPGIDHMPEPWWGWSPNAGKTLYSVCLNLQPGEGGTSQTRKSVTGTLTGCTYEAMVTNGDDHPEVKTVKWHTNNRARPIISLLPDYHDLDKSAPLNHHLSVEFSPLHAATAVDLEDYVAKHHDEVLNHSLLLAADASRAIPEYSPLHNVVLVRCLARRFITLCALARVVAVPLTPLNESPCKLRIKTCCSRYDDITFICFWDARNSFPTKDLAKTIEELTNKKTIE